MKNELKMQYLNLKLKIGGMVTRLQEYEGAMAEKQAKVDELTEKLAQKTFVPSPLSYHALPIGNFISYCVRAPWSIISLSGVC